MFKRLKRWLRGPEKTTPIQQLHTWLQSLPQIPARCNVPPSMYISLCAALEDQERFLVFWEYDEKMSGVAFNGVWVFPDPSVTEFTSR